MAVLSDCSSAREQVKVEALARSTPTPGIPPPEVGPTLSDHWHKAFGIYVCDRWLPDPQSDFDPEGVHSHQDGLMHIHPFSRKVTGIHATLGLFAQAMFMELDDGSVTSLEGGSHASETTSCDGVPAVLRVAIWDAPPETVPTGPPDRMIFEDLVDVHLDRDGGALAIALVPVGAAIPVPPSSNRLENLHAPTPVPLGPVDGQADSGGQLQVLEGGYVYVDPPQLGTGVGIPWDGEPLPLNLPGLGTDVGITWDGELVTINPPPEYVPFKFVLLIQPVVRVTESDTSPLPCYPGAFDPDICFVVGDDPAMESSGVLSAVAAPSRVAETEDWQVNLTLTPDGIEQFNEIALQCFKRSAQCPTGQVAMIGGSPGQFVAFSAPSVNARSFEADEIVIYGQFDQRLAEGVALYINDAAES